MIPGARSRGLPTTTIAVALLTTLLVGVTSAHAGSLTVAWDPSPDPSVIGYRVYVGSTSGAYTEIYDVGNVRTFSYNAAEGQTLYFAVAAYAPGPLVGPRSSEVSASAGPPGDPANFWSAVWAARATSSHAASSDGRLFQIAGNRRLRVTTTQGVAPKSVIIADRSTTLNQVAVDPTFAITGWIWVSETQKSPDGRRTFTVARYRVVNNRAGQRAGMVSGITLPPSGNALFAVAGSGHIYVAVPGTPDGSEPYWGRVLRFNPDGSVPQDGGDGSPVIGFGYAFPHALALEPFGDRVWLSGVDR